MGRLSCSLTECTDGEGYRAILESALVGGYLMERTWWGRLLCNLRECTGGGGYLAVSQGVHWCGILLTPHVASQLGAPLGKNNINLSIPGQGLRVVEGPS